MENLLVFNVLDQEISVVLHSTVLLNENSLLSSAIFRMPHGYSCRWKQVIWLQNLYLFYIWTQTYKYNFNLDFSKKADTRINWGKTGTLPRLFGNLPRIICHFGKSWYRWPHLNLIQQHSHLWQSVFVAAVFVEVLYVDESTWQHQYDHFTKSFGKALLKHLYIEIYI